MSKTVDVELNCPRCQTSFSASLYRTIWVELPDNMDLIVNNKINLVRCPACGLTEMPPFPFMATNVEKNIAVWYEPIPDTNIDADIALYRLHFGADNVYARAQRIKDWEQFKSRLVQLNSLPDVSVTAEEFLRFRRGMQSAYAERSESRPKPTRKDEMFVQLVGRLREGGHEIPNAVIEIPDFPCSSFAALKNSLSKGEFRLYCPALSYNSDIFTVLANRTESFRFFVAALMTWLLPIICIALAIFIFWLWAFLSPPIFFAGWKLGRKSYMNALIRSASESEQKFCFLFYSYKIGVASLPDMTQVYVWQGSYPGSSSVTE